MFSAVIASGFWPRRRTIIVAMAAMVLLPIEASDAGWLSDLFNSSPKQGKSAKQRKPPKHVASPKPRTPAKRAASPKRHTTKLAALGPVQIEPCRFQAVRSPVRSRKIPDRSGRGSYRRIGRRDQRPQRLRVCLQSAPCEADRGEAEGRRLCRDQVASDRGQARRSLVKRVDAANDLRADLLLSIHHDSVPNKFLEDWEFEGKKSRFSDRFSGYSVFVSRSNPDFKTSLSLAELIGKEMKAGLLRDTKTE